MKCWSGLRIISLPTFALAGRRRGVRIASTGPDKETALRTLMQRLVELGHRRIVMLAREVCRKPIPGRIEQVFLDELMAHGIQHGDYNMPNWKESSEGLQQVLDSLFERTPPTALIIGESSTFIAVQQHLARRGILAPRDVSLVCDDPDPVFAWCQPTVAHIQWDGIPVARRVVRWADNVARGKDDRRASFIKATLDRRRHHRPRAEGEVEGWLRIKERESGSLERAPSASLPGPPLERSMKRFLRTRRRQGVHRLLDRLRVGHRGESLGGCPCLPGEVGRIGGVVAGKQNKVPNWESPPSVSLNIVFLRPASVVGFSKKFFLQPVPISEGLRSFFLILTEIRGIRRASLGTCAMARKSGRRAIAPERSESCGSSGT